MARKKKINEDKIVESRMNDLAGIISGLSMMPEGIKPANKVNSLEFIRSQIRSETLTLDRLTLSRMYMQFGLCQAIAEVPVYDAFRKSPILKLYERGAKNVKAEVDLNTETYRKPQGILKKIMNVAGFRSNEEDKKDTDNKKNDNKEKVDVLDKVALDKRAEWQKKADELDAKEREQLSEHLYKPADQWKIRALLIAAKEQHLYEAIESALIWSRVYGGGAVVINAPDHCGALDTPLDLNKLRKGDQIDWIPVDCWELMGEKPDVAVGSPDTNVNWLDDCPFTLMGHKIHKSRVLIFKGKEIPSMYRPIGRGWGMSYFEHLARTLTITWKAQNSRAELLDDAKTDIFKLKGLNQQATNPALNAALQRRLALIQKGKNYGSGVAIDAEDDHKSKQVQFSGFDKMQEQDRYDCAADARIVMTKLYGMTPNGFSNGDNDRASYEDMVRSEVQNKCIPNMITAFKILCKTQLDEELDVDVDFPPLTDDNPEQDVKIKKEILSEVLQGYSYGFITHGQAARILTERDVFWGVAVDPDLPVAPDPALVKFSTNPLMNKA